MSSSAALTLLVPNNLGSSLAFKAPSPSVGKVAVKVMILPPIVPYIRYIRHSRQLPDFPRMLQPDFGLTISLWAVCIAGPKALPVVELSRNMSLNLVKTLSIAGLASVRLTKRSVGFGR
jgi:hypothetical protein